MNIGEHLHMDLLPLVATSIRGNTFLLIAVDEKSGYISTAPLKTKSAKAICEAIMGIVCFFNSFGHKVLRITSDDERNFHATKDLVAKYGITLNTTPSELHERRCERYIQTLKDRKRSTLASLAYELPPKLEAEAYTYIANLMNTTPNTVTGAISPYQLVTGQKLRLPAYYFGQTRVFQSKRKDSDIRGEWGIFLGYGSNNHQYLRAFIPLRSAGYSRRKFVPHPHMPPEWNLPARLRPPETKSLNGNNLTAVGSSEYMHSTKIATFDHSSASQINQHIQSGSPFPIPSSGDELKNQECDQRNFEDTTSF
jgi:hypothetical protein